MGIADVSKKYRIDEMVRGDCLFAATGVTDGTMLRGVRFGKDIIVTQYAESRPNTAVMRSFSLDRSCEQGDGVRLKRPMDLKPRADDSYGTTDPKEATLVTLIQMRIAAAKQRSARGGR
jgi:hypothetical protein